MTGSWTSQRTTRVGSAKNGSRCNVVGSGNSTMSDSLIAFHPAIEEPSNITPSANTLSSTTEPSSVTCWSLPFRSVKRRSTKSILSSLIAFRTSFAVVIVVLPFRSSRSPASACLLPKLNFNFQTRTMTARNDDMISKHNN